MKKTITVLALSVAGFLQAQQDAQYTQYMYNTLSVNPAYAGSRGALSVFGLHRTQWVGLDGAPVTNNVAVHTPIQNSNLGVGLSFVNDAIGISDDNRISGDVSYTVRLNEKAKLSFGLRASAQFLSVDYTRLTVPPGSPLPENVNRDFRSNLGAGVYWHSDRSYIGLSVPQLLESRRYEDNTTQVISERMHWYAIGGHVFRLTEHVEFKPAALAKIVNGSPLQLDLSANFQLHQKFVAGLGYRWDAACSALAGFQVSDAWFIGYTYDMDTTALAHYNSGSHELFLRFELFGKHDKIVSPRFF